MADDCNDPEPQRPEDRLQEQLRLEAERKAKETDARAAQFLEERRDEYLKLIPNHDPDQANSIAAAAARLQADEYTRGSTVFFRDASSAVQAATKIVEAAIEQQARVELVAEKTTAAPQARHEPTPREQGMPGRYDVLTDLSKPTASAAPDNPHAALTGDEILSRGNDPALQTRFDRQQTEQRARTPDNATPENASPATPRSAATGDARQQLKESAEQAKKEVFARPRFTREKDEQANERDNDGGRSRGGTGGRSR